jgi:hypothetical protein
MKTRSLFSLLTIGLAAIMSTTMLPSIAQTPAPTFRPPRTPDGQPNLMGIWQVMNTAHYGVEPHNASLGLPAGVGVIVDPADGKIPYRPEVLAKRNENFRNRAKLDPHEKCYKPGTPHMIYLPFPFQIIQTPTQVSILSEYVHNTRHIYLTRKSHWPPDSVDLWNGDSVGRFEGDVFITDVANFNGHAWLDRSGNFHSDALKVTERLRLIDPDTMQYEATLEDAKTYTRPWTMRMLLYRHKEPQFRILEYECHAYKDDSLKEPTLPTVP